jgi:hypothetical protein
MPPIEGQPTDDGNLNYACELMGRVESCLIALRTVDNARMIEDTIELVREMHALTTRKSADKIDAYSLLAKLLRQRLQREADDGILEKITNLVREALSLSPERQANRASSCGNLAISLRTRYNRTGDVGLLDAAIDLEREALDLYPVGHPHRAFSCRSLAISLSTRYDRTGDVGLLDAAIDLEREALDLYPVGHPHRASSCGSLGISLSTRYNRTGDVTLLHESRTLFEEAVAISPVHAIWRHSHRLARILLLNTSPLCDVPQAILYVSQSLQHDTDDPLGFVSSLSSLLNNLWECNTERKHIQLATIYPRVVNLLPLLIHPALGLQPQLQALKGCTQLGSDAFVNAALADNWSKGLETLELAQGVIWSTTLHRRDPQLKDVPEHLASKLQGLLQSLTMSSVAQPDQRVRKPFISPRDILHSNTSRLYAVIREIRTHSGLERFMLGESVDTLCTAASDHPVVVLVGAREHYYALVLAVSLANGHAVLSLDLSDEDLTSLSFTRGSTRAHRSDATLEETPEEEGRADLKKTKRAPPKPLDGQLQTLWQKVVKPVLAHLGIEVSGQTSLDDISVLTNNTHISLLGGAVPEHAYIGVLLESSAIYLYTLQGFTTARLRFAALTL